MTIEQHFNLKDYNTFGIAACASAFTIIQDKAELPELAALKKVYKDRFLVLGGGSNVLFTEDFPGLVVLNRLNGIQQIAEDEHSVTLEVASGTVWHDLVLYTVERNWGGLENLSLIPGSVGAAPIQNIGAYGSEIKDVLLSVEAYDLERDTFDYFDNADCHFAYRESIFKRPEYRDRYFITAITIRLQKHPDQFNISYGDIQKTLEASGYVSPSVKAISAAVIKIRQSKLPDPKELGNAGSFFKNPEISAGQWEKLHDQFPTMPVYHLENGKKKIPAAWLIEQCGWKGFRSGHTGNHARQALVIVNYGGASGNEIKGHALRVKASVLEKFGIHIEPEVNFIPRG